MGLYRKPSSYIHHVPRYSIVSTCLSSQTESRGPCFVCLQAIYEHWQSVQCLCADYSLQSKDKSCLAFFLIRLNFSARDNTSARLADRKMISLKLCKRGAT